MNKDGTDDLMMMMVEEKYEKDRPTSSTTHTQNRYNFYALRH